MTIASHIQSSDWKTEKHAPAINCPDRFEIGKATVVELVVGQEQAHPHTTEHHIRWIQLFFKPDGGKFIFELGRFDFTAHGESVQGANNGPAYTEASATAKVKLNEAGTLIALSYCNIHGLWESSKEVSVS